jgi:hypothetical protein
MTMAADDRLRASDADRERIAARLREHYAEGRLTREELDERISATLSAKTFGDLREVMSDLPEPGMVPGTAAQPWAWQPMQPPRQVPVRTGPPVLPLAFFLLFLVLLPGAGWVFFGFIQFVLVLALAAALVTALGRSRARRPTQRRRYDQSYYSL